MVTAAQQEIRNKSNWIMKFHFDFYMSKLFPGVIYRPSSGTGGGEVKILREIQADWPRR
jgi:hypothetical protein